MNIDAETAEKLGMSTEEFVRSQTEEPMVYRPELVEEMMKTTFDFHKEDLFEKYEPVLY
jgi:hypothetical protein